MYRRERRLYINKNHPFYSMSSKGKISEARLIMAEQLGRSLVREEIVHHIDNNAMNNSLDNLMVLSYQKHQLITRRDRLIQHLDKMKVWKNKVEEELKTVNKELTDIGLT